MKRRILKDFELSRIAAVDRPCQEHAKMTIMKRAPVSPPKIGALQARAEKSARVLNLIKRMGKVHSRVRAQ